MTPPAWPRLNKGSSRSGRSVASHGPARLNGSTTVGESKREDVLAAVNELGTARTGPPVTSAARGRR